MNIEAPSRTGGEFAGAIFRAVFGTFFRLLGTYVVCVVVSLISIAITRSDTAGAILAWVLFAALSPFWAKHLIALKGWYDFLHGSSPTRDSPANDESAAELPAHSVVLGALVEDGRETEHIVYLGPDDRNRHVYAVGKTRTGKTTLLRNLVVQDMELGHGVGFIDPHGDAALELLAAVPERRIDDVVYFDPASKHAPSFNPLAVPYPAPKLTEDIVSVFKMFFGDSWGPRLEHLLRFGVLTLLSDSKQHSLSDLRRILIDEDFRDELLARIKEPGIRSFWLGEFPTIPQTAVHPILNKLSAFLAPGSDLERIFSRTENDLDFSAIMNGRKILIVNLAKGVIGEEPSRILGGLIVSGMQQAALARASLPVSDRHDFHLFVDEFQNYVVASFETILSEAAKYRLNLTLANQTLGQLPKSLERAIFGNCSTLIAFQISAEDAPALGREMHYADTVVRPKGTNELYPLRDFVASKRALYESAGADAYLGMSHAERKDYRSLVRFKPAYDGVVIGTRDVIARTNMADGVIAERRAHIAQVLRVLNDEEHLDVATLKELFRDYEFRQRVFPEVGDFVNLAPRHAIIRIGRASDVAVIRTLPPAGLNPEIRSEIQRRLAEVAEGRVDAEKAEPVELREQPESMAAESKPTYATRKRARRRPALSAEP